MRYWIRVEFNEFNNHDESNTGERREFEATGENAWASYPWIHRWLIIYRFNSDLPCVGEN